MHDVSIFARDKNGNKGPFIAKISYPTAEQAKRARSAIIWLCINQRKFPKEWNIKRAVVELN